VNGTAPKNLVASVRDRLRTLARHQREDYNFTLMRYANERFLYWLGRSPHRRDFVLKGAMLLPLWGAETYRPTRDIDLLGFGDPAWERLSRVFGEVAALQVEPDGMAYQADRVTIEAIRARNTAGSESAFPARWATSGCPSRSTLASAMRSRRQRSRPSTQPCWTCPPS
jgi:hypothetical protein